MRPPRRVLGGPGSAAASPNAKMLNCCHIILMVTRAKATESPAPNLGPRTTRITLFAFRNRATPIPPSMAPPAPTAIYLPVSTQVQGPPFILTDG
jgi:hypothetical protein